MTGDDIQRLGVEVGLDVVGATPAVPYAETEAHIRDRRARGLFADMKFTMAHPEESCHPERLLPGARSVVSAALCYYADEPERRFPAIYLIQGHTGQLDMWRNRSAFRPNVPELVEST